MRILGLDVGGANVKYAVSGATAGSVSFALWRSPAKLTGVLCDIVERCLPLDGLALTMTGELCDCFPTKAVGVRSILESTLEASAVAEARQPRGSENRLPALVWTVDGTWVSLDDALANPLPAAAANWLALASFAGRYVANGAAILIDIGTTTTDLIPIQDGRPVPSGRVDYDRLLAGELVYAGAARTPIAMLVESLPHRGAQCPVAREVFATLHDAYLLLGKMAELPDSRDTADGCPATQEHARARMARMLCLDSDTFSKEDAVLCARAVHEKFVALVRSTLNRVLSRDRPAPSSLILSGCGEFIAREVAPESTERVVSLTEELGDERSRAACAVAVAELAHEHLTASLNPNSRGA